MSRRPSAFNATTTELLLSLEPYDITPEGVVSPITEMRWLEALRQRLFGRYLSYERQAAYNSGAVATATQWQRFGPIVPGDQPLGRIALQEIDRERWIVYAEIMLHEKRVAHATQSGVFIDRATQRPTLAPDELAVAFRRAVLHENRGVRA